MKKLFAFVLIGLFCCSVAQAQVKTRKIPFLPYAGMPMQATVATSAGQGIATTPAAKSFETIYFDKDSSSLRNDQRKKIVKISKRLKREGGSHYSIVAFTSPDIPASLARKRADAVVHALSDFKVGSPVVHFEHRNSSVINPNRVEVYMRASTNSLGSASSNFGQR